jgi:hypothetical protein
MDTGRRALLNRLWSEGRVFDTAQPDRLDRRRNLEPESAELLALLVRAAGADRVLELGTPNGYSTIWLGARTRDLTLELAPASVRRGTSYESHFGMHDVILSS